MRRLALTFCVVIALPVAAQDAPENAENAANPRTVEARALFARGSELAEQRRFSEAAEAFARSTELMERPSTLFNLGLCYYALGRHVEGLQVLERYVAIADAAVEGASLTEARDMIRHSAGQIGELILDILPETASVTLDGDTLDSEGGTRRARVNPGTHVVRAEAPGHAPALVEIPMRPGSTVRRAISLESTTVPTRLEVRVSRDDAQIRIDGELVGEGNAALEVEPGEHQVEVHHRDLAPVQRTLEVETGERRVLDLALQQPLVPEPDDRERPRWRHPVLWAVIGAVVVGAGIGIGVAASGREGDPSGGSTGIVLATGSRGSGGVIIRP